MPNPTRDRPLTSILLPCWNALELTQTCLRQVMRSTTQSFELVVVDNGSTDATRAWLRSQTFKRLARANRACKGVKLLFNRENRGYAAAMNQALAAARGELLVFANADAAPAPLWLEEMSSEFLSRKKCGGLSPCANVVHQRGAAGSWGAGAWYADLEAMQAFAAACAMMRGAKAYERARASFIPGFWFMTSRRVIRRVGSFDEGFGLGGFEDWDLQMRMRKAGLELGFASRAYAHHVWSGVLRSNGFQAPSFYRGGRRRFEALHPRARNWPLRILSPLD